MPNYLDNLDVIDAKGSHISVLLQDRETLALATNNSLKIGDLSELTTEDKSSIVNAINSLGGGVYNESTPDSGLTTNIGLKAGTYNVTTDLVINAQLVVPKGAIINIANGVSVTINQSILADRYQIFSGDLSRLTINKGTNPVGYPEWFGAKVNDSTFDNSSALNFCLSHFTVTSLASGIYYVSNTVVMSTPDSVLTGCGMNWGNGGTAIQASVNLYPTVLMGFDTLPATINEFCNGLRIEKLCISGVGHDYGAGSTALKMSFALRGSLNEVQCRDAEMCLWIRGSVAMKISHCHFFSTLLSTDDTTRTSDLIRIYDTETNLGIGAAASIQIINCHFSIGGIAYSESYGIRAFGARFSDLMITGCEINSVYTGIILVGNNDRVGTLDILISNNLIDSVVNCVGFYNMAYGMVNFVNNYLAGVASSNYLMNIQTCTNILVDGCQFIGYNSTNVAGIVVNSSTNLQLINNNFYEVNSAILTTGAMYYSKITGNVFDSIKSGDYLINSASLKGCIIELLVAGTFTYGIYAGEFSKNTINMSGIENATITNPIMMNGVDVTPSTNGYDSTSTNYYYGIFA